MLNFLARRLAYSVIVVAGVLLVVFITTRLIGDPARIILPVTATQADYEAQRSRMGLDQPIITQFVEYVGGAVRFDFGTERDRELPLILGLMPNLPRHAIDPERFDETTLDPPLGSGPYKVAEVRPAESVLLRTNSRETLFRRPAASP